MAHQQIVLDEEGFNEWFHSPATQSVMAALKNNAFVTKMGVMDGFWDASQPDMAQQILYEKEAARQYTEAVLDLTTITHADYDHYRTRKAGE